jgi:hypothetical protein
LEHLGLDDVSLNFLFSEIVPLLCRSQTAGVWAATRYIYEIFRYLAAAVAEQGRWPARR